MNTILDLAQGTRATPRPECPAYDAVERLVEAFELAVPEPWMRVELFKQVEAIKEAKELDDVLKQDSALGKFCTEVCIEVETLQDALRVWIRDRANLVDAADKTYAWNLLYKKVSVKNGVTKEFFVKWIKSQMEYETQRSILGDESTQDYIDHLYSVDTLKKAVECWMLFRLELSSIKPEEKQRAWEMINLQCQRHNPYHTKVDLKKAIAEEDARRIK